MIFFILLVSLYFVFTGALWGRLDGGGWKSPEWLERLLVMSAFVISTATFAGLYSVASLAGVAGIATGHGQYFLATVVKAISPEFFDFLVRPLFGKDPRTKEEYKAYRDDEWHKAPQEIKDKIHLEMQDYGMEKLYWRCVFGMFVTGSIVGLPAFILAMIFGKLWGTLYLLTGVVKAIAYMLGYKFWRSTEPAEYINGGGRHFLCLLVIILEVILWVQI